MKTPLEILDKNLNLNYLHSQSMPTSVIETAMIEYAKLVVEQLFVHTRVNADQIRTVGQFTKIKDDLINSLPRSTNQ